LQKLEICNVQEILNEKKMTPIKTEHIICDCHEAKMLMLYATKVRYTNVSVLCTTCQQVWSIKEAEEK
jgi:hypothetical protein